MKATNSEFLLSCIGDADPKYIENAERKARPQTKSAKKRTNRILRLAPVAACLVMIMAITAIFGNNAGWFNSKVYTVELGGGTLNFYKSGAAGLGDLAFGDVTSRDLTQEENKVLLGELADVELHGRFNAEDGALVHVEGKIGETKIIFGAHGFTLADTVIETDRSTSEINGISVSAGYFITKANSQGIKNIIYLASFQLGDTSVYVELGGAEANSENLRETISDLINRLTKLEMIDLSNVTY